MKHATTKGKALISWIGGNDLQAHPSHPKHHQSRGPLLSTLMDRKFAHAHLIYNYAKKEVTPYLEWLQSQIDTEITANHVKLSSPVDFADIYQAANKTLQDIWQAESGHPLSILLSPGTPAMQAVWILLGKTRYPASFIQSSIEQGVQDVQLPFDIAAEFLPELTSRAARQLSNLMADSAPSTAAFDTIISHNPGIKRLKERAATLASRDVPVLIQGDTGTGKELFARAIHNASPRAAKRFVALNCGAIPKELIDATLFGHAKGAFTGAIKDNIGVFEDANGGTLFLDEFGDLPADAQVRLLRVLQEGTLTRVGDTKERNVDVRIITATHKNLSQAVAAGEFREDLYYRIAIGVLKLPPIREREGDLGLLADKLLERINEEASGQPNYKHKNISPGAKNVILNHDWPGNVRELHASLLRASIWSTQTSISEIDMRESMLDSATQNSSLLNRDIGKYFEIQSVIDELEYHYVLRAWEKSGHKKKLAADLLGYNNYQTFDKRLKKLGIK
ncbi:MAG: sigma-54 interaction domain-containing protein [Thiohalomonadales bacterium]